MVDRSVVGRRLQSATMTVEPERLRLFAQTIGQTDEIYTDDDAAVAAGYPGLLVPPTFLFTLELEQPEPFAWVTGLGVSLRHLLHAEQSFVYRATAFAGDTLTAEPRIADVYAKKRGALEFIVKRTDIWRDDNTKIADLESVWVERHPRVEDT